MTMAEAAAIETGAPKDETRRGLTSVVGGGQAMRYELSPDLVTLCETRPAEAEAVRTIRTHIIARHLKGGRRGLAVCAPSEGVGCTFTAINLAISLAQVGVATLFVEGNLRNPHLEHFIRPETPPIGLKQACENHDRNLGDYIHPEVLPNLSLLYAGGMSDHAQEILASEDFKWTMDRCLRDFEFTVIDTPPADLCADARRIGTIIGYSLIVCRSHVTLISQVAQLAAELREDGARVVGTVLNEV
jgi:protein-tyrosine kinase